MDARDCARARALQMVRGEFSYLPFVATGEERLAGQEQPLSGGRLTEAAQGRGGFLDVEIEAAKLGGVKTLEVAK